MVPKGIGHGRACGRRECAHGRHECLPSSYDRQECLSSGWGFRCEA
jgi:hypothetical protein